MRYLLPPISRRRRSARLSLRSSLYLHYASGPTRNGKSSRLRERDANKRCKRPSYYHRDNQKSRREPCWHWPGVTLGFVTVSEARIPMIVRRGAIVLDQAIAHVSPSRQLHNSPSFSHFNAGEHSPNEWPWKRRAWPSSHPGDPRRGTTTLKKRRLKYVIQKVTIN